jgi:hypothetical protein
MKARLLVSAGRAARPCIVHLSRLVFAACVMTVLQDGFRWATERDTGAATPSL